MYRARREIEPNIPRSAAEFCQQIQSTQFVVYYRGEVTVGSEIGVLFYSDKLSQVFAEVKDIQFDGTFYTVPIQCINSGRYLQESGDMLSRVFFAF